MEKPTKLTKEIIERLILAEINNLPEEQLQELNWLSKLKGGFKGIKKAATDAYKAGEEEQVQHDFIKKYATAFTNLWTQLNDLPDEMLKDAAKFSLEKEIEAETGGIKSLAKRIRDVADDLQEPLRDMFYIAKNAGVDIEGVRSEKVPAGEGGVGIEDPKDQAELDADEKKSKPGLMKRAGSALKGVFDALEENEGVEKESNG